jgi:hypothetical protein
MTRIPTTDMRWRIQVRADRTAAWKNKSGLFETKWMAVQQARRLREGRAEGQQPGEGYGRGNVRVIKHVKATKA